MVEASVDAWCGKRGLPRNDRRSIMRAVRQGATTTRSSQLECYLEEELKHPVQKGALAVSGRAPDYFGDFAEQVEEFAGRLEKCRGPYTVVRAGYDEIEHKRKPTWKQLYELEIRALDSSGAFVFSYRGVGGAEEAQNTSEVKGYAFSTKDTFYLPGVDPEAEDGVTLFILQEHATFGYDLLVGMQLAKLDDEIKQPNGKSLLRELGVGRRVAAYRSSSRYSWETLGDAAREWVRQESMGAVITFSSKERRNRHR